MRDGRYTGFMSSRRSWGRRAPPGCAGTRSRRAWTCDGRSRTPTRIRTCRCCARSGPVAVRRIRSCTACAPPPLADRRVGDVEGHAEGPVPETGRALRRLVELGQLRHELRRVVAQEVPGARAPGGGDVLRVVQAAGLQRQAAAADAARQVVAEPLQRADPLVQLGAPRPAELRPLCLRRCPIGGSVASASETCWSDMPIRCAIQMKATRRRMCRGRCGGRRQSARRSSAERLVEAQGGRRDAAAGGHLADREPVFGDSAQAGSFAWIAILKFPQGLSLEGKDLPTCLPTGRDA